MTFFSIRLENKARDEFEPCCRAFAPGYHKHCGAPRAPAPPPPPQNFRAAGCRR